MFKYSLTDYELAGVLDLMEVVENNIEYIADNAEEENMKEYIEEVITLLYPALERLKQLGEKTSVYEYQIGMVKDQLKNNKGGN